MREPEGTRLVLARELLGVVTAKDFIVWAVNALGQGLDTPALCSLAGLDLEGEPLMHDARQLFRKALEELGVVAPTEPEIMKWYVASLAREILEGRVAPLAGAERIHSEVLSPLNHPPDLMVWCYLSEGLNPGTFEELEGSALDETILRAARDFTKRGAT